LVGKAEQPEGEAESKREADVKSLMADFLASTRNPIGSSGLFNDPFGATSTETHNSQLKRSDPLKRSDAGRSLFWEVAVYVVTFFAVVVAAAIYLVA
jgi:hypothetical protein